MGTPDTNLSAGRQHPGDAGRPGDTLDRDRTPATVVPAEGSPADGAPHAGDDGAKAES